MTLTVKEICDKFEGSYTNFDSLPEYLVSSSLSGKGADAATVLKHGKAWAFEYIEKFQPKTYGILMNGGPLTLIYRMGSTGHLMNLIMEVNGQAIEIVRQRHGFNSSDPEFPAKSYAGKRAQSLPEAVRLSFYHRIDGMGVPENAGMGPFTRILPYPVSRPWQSIDGYLSDIKLKKKMLPIVEEMIPGVRPSRMGDSYTNFMMFLNSWGSFVGRKRTDGDHLFVKTHIHDGVVYYIRDADVANMMILADPGEAIDRYCAHVLLRNEERFDFRPWAVPFETPSEPHSPSL